MSCLFKKRENNRATLNRRDCFRIVITHNTHSKVRLHNAHPTDKGSRLRLRALLRFRLRTCCSPCGVRHVKDHYE